MGRNKTTGSSHNKKASTYKSNRSMKADKKQQQTLHKFLKNARTVDEEEEEEETRSSVNEHIDEPGTSTTSTSTNSQQIDISVEEVSEETNSEDDKDENVDDKDEDNTSEEY